LRAPFGIEEEGYESLELTSKRPHEMPKPQVQSTPPAQAAHILGDATAPVGDGPFIICHVCNDEGEWGAGFTRALSAKWPEPEASYRGMAHSVGLRLGFLQRVKVDPATWVFNLVAQRGVGMGQARVDLAALKELLASTARSARLLGASVHMPRIGSGLADGDWSEIGPLVDKLVASRAPAFVYTLPGEAHMFPEEDWAGAVTP
jgi:O-acetyl-ADP-ribose deacetylase (regulator of RNase III)